jgi:hypothetical protein
MVMKVGMGLSGSLSLYGWPLRALAV